jgi:hypothetical protein
MHRQTMSETDRRECMCESQSAAVMACKIISIVFMYLLYIC